MLDELSNAVVAGMGPPAARWVLRSSWVAPSWHFLYHAMLNLSHIHIHHKYICVFAAISHLDALGRLKVSAGYMLPLATA